MGGYHLYVLETSGENEFTIITLHKANVRNVRHLMSKVIERDHEHGQGDEDYRGNDPVSRAHTTYLF